MTKYIKVEQPEYQFFMDHPRFDECCYLVEDNSYMIPEDIYEKFYKPMKKFRSCKKKILKDTAWTNIRKDSKQYLLITPAQVNI